MNNQKNGPRQFYPDFIRVIAMLLILIYHFQAELFTRTTYLNNHNTSLINDIINTWGLIGVSLFLSLSGACLTISGKEFSIKKFYQKRFLSIFPRFYIVWTMAFCGTLFFLPARLTNIQPWTIFLTFLGLDGYLYEIIPNFYMTGEWFLGCLILLYLLYPLLRYIMIHFSSKIVWGVIFVSYPLLVLFYPFSFSIGRMFYLYIPEFMFGMYVIYQFATYTRQQTLSSLFLALICIFLYQSCPTIAASGISISLFMLLRNLGHCLQEHGFSRLQKLLKQVASYSYEVFLLHHFYLNLLLERFFSTPHMNTGVIIILFLFWCGTTFFFSWCLHLVYQKICDRLKNLCYNISIKH